MPTLRGEVKTASEFLEVGQGEGLIFFPCSGSEGVRMPVLGGWGQGGGSGE